MAFTDGSANGRASIVTRDKHKVLQKQETSAQRAELTAVIEAFVMFAEEEFNLYSDSQYVVRLFLHTETAVLPENKTVVLPENKTAIFPLLTKLQQQIWKRNQAYFIGHIRAHSGLPGPLNALNDLAYSLTKATVAPVFEEARASHSLHHQNTTALRYQIPQESAREIVHSCSHCPTAVVYLWELTLAVSDLMYFGRWM